MKIITEQQMKSNVTRLRNKVKSEPTLAGKVAVLAKLKEAEEILRQARNNHFVNGDRTVHIVP